MSVVRYGVSAAGGDASAVLARVVELEAAGIGAAWLTTGGAGIDGLTVFAAAAARTQRIKLGTSIVPTWPRHPIVAVQQAQVVESLAPGRFRLGIGPSHKPAIEAMYGFDFKAPLGHLKEYVHVVRTLMHKGAVDFDGAYYTAHARIAAPMPHVPVMASALRHASFEYCGAETDGAISWVCPPAHLEKTALPAINEGARRSGREAPPLIAHVPVCVHDRVDEVRQAVREQLATYPKLPFYARMFADAGFPEALETAQWSDRMIDATVAHGDDDAVSTHLKRVLEAGAAEVLISVVTAGTDHRSSWSRAIKLISQVSA